MGKINYENIYKRNKHGWFDMTEDPQRYEALLAGHYSDSNHFVYELLQNAEDAFEADESGVFNPLTCIHANKVVIQYYSDKLVFYHNGKPFDENDVRGVSSMLMGTKDRDDAQTIGRFGMGFKSVFKYTYQPEIYSDEEAFKITRYLLPVEIADGWNPEREKGVVSCKLSDGRYIKPFHNEKHLTKIVIPFKKYDKSGGLQSIAGDEVLKKLEELDGEILLFLTHIRELYWINKETGKYAYISLESNEQDEKLITCRIEGSAYKEREEITRYLKFKKIFNHAEMDNVEVSVAYKLNNRADNVNEVKKSPVWVYFPTRDDTNLPFLIHGSFETAVSREKLMTPSSFNSDLFDELGNLVADSMNELAKRNLITQNFIRRILINAFKDEIENNTIPGLKDKISKTISKKGLLPDRNGFYGRPDEMFLPIPYRMMDFVDKPLIGKVFKNKKFVAFNNEREVNFSDYYSWLVDDLEMELFDLSALAEGLTIFEGERINLSGERYKSLRDFYDFLSDNMESVYTTGLSYSRSGPYEASIKGNISKAWEKLRSAPIIINRNNYLVSSIKNGNQFLYLGASSNYMNVMQNALVNKNIADEFFKLLQEGFNIPEFNNIQYVKEKVIQKYINDDYKKNVVRYDISTDEYLEDLQQIITVIEENENNSEITELLKDCNIIRVKTPEEGNDYSRPQDCFVPFSKDGINLKIYYATIPKYDGMSETELEDCNKWEKQIHFNIDDEFYESNGISMSNLMKLGVISTPINEGYKERHGVGDDCWMALGDYCPRIKIDFLEDNLWFIEEYPGLDLAKEKSVEIIKMLLQNAKKLTGKRRIRLRSNPYMSNIEEASILYDIKNYHWVYNSAMEVNYTTSLSKYDLSKELYGELAFEKEFYSILGFVEKEADVVEDIFNKVENLGEKDRRLVLRQIARTYGMEIPELTSDKWEEQEKEEMIFDPRLWRDEEFPVNRINNIEYLRKHVQEQFYCADPVTYKPVLRQIRVSKNSKSDRTYAIGMYTNSSNVKICQMCKKPIAFIEVNQISNYGIEMPQLNLCLCRECSAKYKMISGANKEEFKNQIREAIMSLDIDEEDEEYSIEFNDETALHFTQTHVAEIQEIFKLLSEYGTPSYEEEDDVEEVSGPLLHPVRKKEVFNSDEQKNTIVLESQDEENDIAEAGKFITYKKLFSNGEIYDNILQPEKYSLHKALEGHKVGEVIVFQGRKYEIIGL